MSGTIYQHVETGQTYHASDVRPLPDNWRDLVKAGHPLAVRFNENQIYEVLFVADDKADDEFVVIVYVKGNHVLSSYEVFECLHLAPLAYIDGKPVHIGDELEYDTVFDFYHERKISNDDISRLKILSERYRWPKPRTRKMQAQRYMRNGRVHEWNKDHCDRTDIEKSFSGSDGFFGEPYEVEVPA